MQWVGGGGGWLFENRNVVYTCDRGTLGILWPNIYYPISYCTTDTYIHCHMYAQCYICKKQICYNCLKLSLFCSLILVNATVYIVSHLSWPAVSHICNLIFLSPVEEKSCRDHHFQLYLLIN